MARKRSSGPPQTTANRKQLVAPAGLSDDVRWERHITLILTTRDCPPTKTFRDSYGLIVLVGRGFVGSLPKFEGYCDQIRAYCRPPRDLIAIAMKLAVMEATDGDRPCTRRSLFDRARAVGQSEYDAPRSASGRTRRTAA